MDILVDFQPILSVIVARAWSGRCIKLTFGRCSGWMTNEAMLELASFVEEKHFKKNKLNAAAHASGG